jgi:hypothetical protein
MTDGGMKLKTGRISPVAPTSGILLQPVTPDHGLGVHVEGLKISGNSTAASSR